MSGKGKSDDGSEGDKQQLAVKYAEYPDPDKYADDFFFGYLLAVKATELDETRARSEGGQDSRSSETRSSG